MFQRQRPRYINYTAVMASYVVPLFVLQNERRRVYRQRKLLECLSDFEIIQNCGMPYWGLRDLIDLYSSLEGKRLTAIPLETKVLTYMSYLRSGNFQWSMGTLSGSSQSSVSRIIEDCTRVTLGFSKEVITFPHTTEGRNQIRQRFFNYAGIPNVLGLIDGAHVEIKAPHIDEHIYVNRKSMHSINVQVVADMNYKFLDIVAKWPGSTHDSFMWKHSSLRDRMLNGSLGAGWLLGTL